jgi:ureidoglycolate dehydrogenase (NAD+)
VAVSVLDGKGRDPAKVFGLGSVLECLVEADLEGVRTHGAVRLPSYWSRLRSGLISARPRQRIVTDWAAAALLDAGHGPGPLGGRGGMEIAIARARGAGVGAGAARKGNHVGLLGWYVEDAAREGVLALAFGNAPASMAAPGGFTPLLGTNPLGAGGDLRRS